MRLLVHIPRQLLPVGYTTRFRVSLMKNDQFHRNGNYFRRLGYILGLHWGYIGIMEENIETA